MVSGILLACVRIVRVSAHCRHHCGLDIPQHFWRHSKTESNYFCRLFVRIPMVVVRCWLGGISPSLENAPVIELVLPDFDRLAFVFLSVKRKFGWLRSHMHPTSDTKLTTGSYVNIKNIARTRRGKVRLCDLEESKYNHRKTTECMRIGMHGRSSR